MESQLALTQYVLNSRCQLGIKKLPIKIFSDAFKETELKKAVPNFLFCLPSLQQKFYSP
jgi:hypothetical protein